MLLEQIDTRGWAGSEEDNLAPFAYLDCERSDPEPCWGDHFLIFNDEDVDDDQPVVDDRIPTPVRRFAEKHDILRFLVKSVALASTTFPYRAPTLRLESDPSNPEDAWVVIRVIAGGDIEDALSRKRQFSEVFLAGSSWACREKIRLEYRFRDSDETA